MQARLRRDALPYWASVNLALRARELLAQCSSEVPCRSPVPLGIGSRAFEKARRFNHKSGAVAHSYRKFGIRRNCRHHSVQRLTDSSKPAVGCRSVRPGVAPWAGGVGKQVQIHKSLLNQHSVQSNELRAPPLLSLICPPMLNDCDGQCGNKRHNAEDSLQERQDFASIPARLQPPKPSHGSCAGHERERAPKRQVSARIHSVTLARTALA